MQQMFRRGRSNTNLVVWHTEWWLFLFLSSFLSAICSFCNINSSPAADFEETCLLCCLVCSTPVLTAFLFLSVGSFTFCVCLVRLARAVKAVWSLIACPLRSSHLKVSSYQEIPLPATIFTNQIKLPPNVSHLPKTYAVFAIFSVSLTN